MHKVSIQRARTLHRAIYGRRFNEKGILLSICDCFLHSICFTHAVMTLIANYVAISVHNEMSFIVSLSRSFAHIT